VSRSKKNKDLALSVESFFYELQANLQARKNLPQNHPDKVFLLPQILSKPFKCSLKDKGRSDMSLIDH